MTLNISTILDGYAKEAAIASLSASSPTVLDSGSHKERLRELPTLVLTCILGFDSEEISGSLLLCCEKEFLEATSPIQPVTDTGLKDWLGELGNLIVGRVKTSLLTHNISIALNPPSVSLSPVSILESYAERNPSGPFWFDVNGHALCAQLGAEIKIDKLDQPENKGISLHAGGGILEMNPIKKKPKKAARPQQTGNSPSFGKITGVGLEGEGLVVSFLSGATMKIDMKSFLDSGERSLSLSGQEIKISPVNGGLEVCCDGLLFFLPSASAA